MLNLKLNPPTKHSKTIEILINDQVWKKISPVIFGRKTSLRTDFTSLKEFEEYFRHQEIASAKLYALKNLAQRMLSSSQLRTKLTKKEVSEEAIQEILQYCLEKGYINDKHWLEATLHHEISKKNGPLFILNKLKAKKAPGDAASLLEKLYPPEKQIEAIQRLLSTKFRSRALNDPREKQKIIASLQRKGFSYQTILQALKA